MLLVVAIAIGLVSLGGKCDSTPSGSDAGATKSDSAAAEGGPVAATCVDVCRCLGSACADYPFLPDCVTACQDPTNKPVWDLGCRASECSAAFGDHDTHCPNASGQSKCH